MNVKGSLLNAKDFTLFARLATAAVIAVICAVSDAAAPVTIGLCIVAVIIAAYELVLDVARGISRLDVFNERFLVLIALIITLAAGRYIEAVIAAVFFRISYFLFSKLQLHALETAANSASKPNTEVRPRIDAMAHKALRYYVPSVIVVALLLAFIPLIFTGDISPWLSRAAVLLLAASPCAITFALSLCALFSASRISQDGLSLRSISTSDMLAATNTVVFDNSEALFSGQYSVDSVMPVSGLSSHNLLLLAAYASSSAGLPSAQAIAEAFGEALDPNAITGSEQLPGLGVLAHVKGLVVSAGNLAMMDKLGMKNSASALSTSASAIHIAVNGTYAGCIITSRKPNEQAKKAVEELSSAGVSRIVLISSDTAKNTARTAHDLGISEYFSDCSDAEKISTLEKLLAETFPEEALSYIGQDSALLKMADVGISAHGDAEGCDAAFTSANLSSLADAIITARHGRSIAMQGLLFAAAVKLVILILALIGAAPFWTAVLADPVLTVFTIANSMRAGR